MLVASASIGKNCESLDCIISYCSISLMLISNGFMCSCILNPREAICEKGVDDCCPQDPQYGSFCYCDFYNWASTVGYKSEKLLGWCSTSGRLLLFFSLSLTVFTCIRFFRPLTIMFPLAPMSDTFLTRLSSEMNDREGLQLMYKSLNGDFWYENTGWLTDAPFCDWHGVYCTNGRVSSINLNGNNVTGDLSFLGEESPSALVGCFELHEL